MLFVAALLTCGCSSSTPGSVTPPPVTAPLTDAPNTSDQPVGAAQPGGGGGGGDVQVSFKSQVVPILQAHCAKCHTEGRPSPFAMFNKDGTPNQATVAFRITDMIGAIRTGKMPKDAPGSVTSAEIATLEAWAAQGAQDN